MVVLFLIYQTENDMTTLDIQFIIAIIAGIVLGIWIGCKFMDYIYKKDIQQLVNHINDIEKELSK